MHAYILLMPAPFDVYSWNLCFCLSGALADFPQLTNFCSKNKTSVLFFYVKTVVGFSRNLFVLLGPFRFRFFKLMDNESLPLRILHLGAAGVLLWQCMARSGGIGCLGVDLLLMFRLQRKDG